MTVDSALEEALVRLSTLRQHRLDGKRSPHKPLLVLLALGRFSQTGSSALSWSEAEHKLADLIAEYGRPSRTARRQSAAYPFTHLRSDGIWHLDRDVAMDRVGELDSEPVVGRLDSALESALRAPGALERAARVVVEAQFPMTVASDVLASVGLDADAVFAGGPLRRDDDRRRRSAAWPAQILAAWDHQCAFCGYDGRLGPAVVGLEAAHVRWFNFDGPDDLDNGMALCSLHHKLFDRGALGLDPELKVTVSSQYSARTEVAKRVYDLAGRPLQPRRGTQVPAAVHTAWHTREVFKGDPLAA